MIWGPISWIVDDIGEVWAPISTAPHDIGPPPYPHAFVDESLGLPVLMGMQGAARARAPLLVTAHDVRLRLRPNQALASGLCFVCTAQDAPRRALVFGLWRVCFPPVLIRPALRLTSCRQQGLARRGWATKTRTSHPNWGPRDPGPG